MLTKTHSAPSTDPNGKEKVMFEDLKHNGGKITLGHSLFETLFSSVGLYLMNLEVQINVELYMIHSLFVVSLIHS